MDPLTVITAIAAVIQQAVTLGPSIIKGVEDAQPFAELIYQTISGTQVTQQQLNDLEAKLAALSAQLQAPLPADDGTTTT